MIPINPDLNLLREVFGEADASRLDAEIASLGHDQNYIRELSKQDWSWPNVSGLCRYMDHLQQGRVGINVLIRVLPIAFVVWKADLLGQAPVNYGAFVELFFTALAKNRAFNSYFNEAQNKAVSKFMSDTLCERIDHEKGLRFSASDSSPYTWIYQFCSLGFILPIAECWEQWWCFSTEGRACGAFQYSSALFYSETNNPIFSPYSREVGGGPPSLWEYEGFLDDYSWMEVNLKFIKETFTDKYFIERLGKALEHLQQHSDYQIALRVFSDIVKEPEKIPARIAELATVLQDPQIRKTHRSWHC